MARHVLVGIFFASLTKQHILTKLQAIPRRDYQLAHQNPSQCALNVIELDLKLPVCGFEYMLRVAADQILGLL